MTKPRQNIGRELYGIIGNLPERSALQRTWNRYFAEQKRDAFLDYYPTTVETIPERLSEMYHFDRRLYIVGFALTEAIYSYMDHLDPSAVEQGRVTVVCNRRGVLEGRYVSDVFDVAVLTSAETTGEEL